ncbi:MAG TPA: hypothetical protein VLB76_16590 [Thermoanaerobaculia bacterium]|jgi:hypothetical protein|nr:hypothetical protein [Thermoanaerobaculia bacterium]
MEFFVAEGPPVRGELRYDKRGLSFDFRPADSAAAQRTGDAVELAYGSMALQVERTTGEVLGIWGYHPDASWQPAELASPRVTPARLRVRLAEVPPRGVALRLFRAGELTTLRDVGNGWIRVGRTGVPPGDQFIEFAAGCLAELNGTDLVALWLHPGTGA